MRACTRTECKSSKAGFLHSYDEEHKTSVINDTASRDGPWCPRCML